MGDDDSPNAQAASSRVALGVDPMVALRYEWPHGERKPRRSGRGKRLPFSSAWYTGLRAAWIKRWFKG